MAPETRKVVSTAHEDKFVYSRSGASKLFASTGRLKRLTFVFALLGLAAVAANLTFLLVINSEIEKAETFGKPKPSMITAAGTPEKLSLLKATRIWTAIIATITLVCIVSILYLLAKKIIVPLDLVTLATKDISRGDLSITVPTNPHSCLEELGQALNDLTANFQEVLLFTGTTAANSRSSVEKIEKALESRGEKPDDELLEQIRGVTQDLETLGSMVEAFTFYQARFDGQTVIGELCPDKDSDIGRLQSRLELTLKRKPAGPAGKQPTERDLE